MNRSHDGNTAFATPLTFPLVKKWSVALPDQLSYPVIAEGRVFVLSRSINQNYGTFLYALDPANGKTLWRKAIAGTYFWSAMAYGDSRLYVINFDGLMKALNPATGAILWSRQMKGQYAFSSAPTFSNGYVYVGGAGSGGTMYCVNAATGATVWMSPVENGDNSSPAVSDGAVFASYAGNQAFAFSAASGALLWHHMGPVEGGGGKTTALSSVGLFVRDSYDGNRILKLGNGAIAGNFNSDTIPAISGASRYTLYHSVLESRSLSAGVLNWSFRGDGTLVTAPIVVNNFVYVGGSSGALYALRRSDGRIGWQTNVGYGIYGPDEQNVSQPLTGLAAGEGLVVVPAGRYLIAYGN